MFFDAGIMRIVLGLAAMLLALAVVVQVVQEIYKYLTSSQGRLYAKVLVDVLGPWASQLSEDGSLVDLRARGPFQLFRIRPTGTLLPMERDDLVGALERTTAPWYRRALRELRSEAAHADAAPSPRWRSFLQRLMAVSESSPEATNAAELREFLAEWGHEFPSDAEGEVTVPSHSQFQPQAALDAFMDRFTPHVQRVASQYPQLMRNFEYQYRRRNLRQTFLIGLLLAFAANFPVQRLYELASAMSLDDALAAADRATAIYQAQTTSGTPGADSVAVQVLEQFRVRIDSALAVVVRQDSIAADSAAASRFPTALAGIRRFPALGLTDQTAYIFGCLVTALLVSFGAPFWNDLVGALSRAARQRATTPALPEPNGGGA